MCHCSATNTGAAPLDWAPNCWTEHCHPVQLSPTEHCHASLRLKAKSPLTAAQSPSNKVLPDGLDPSSVGRLVSISRYLLSWPPFHHLASVIHKFAQFEQEVCQVTTTLGLEILCGRGRLQIAQTIMIKALSTQQWADSTISFASYKGFEWIYSGLNWNFMFDKIERMYYFNF